MAQITIAVAICAFAAYATFKKEEHIAVAAQPTVAIELYLEQFEPEPEVVEPVKTEHEILTVDESEFKVEVPEEVKPKEEEIIPEPEPEPLPVEPEPKIEPPKPKPEPIKPKVEPPPKPVKKTPKKEQKPVNQATQKAAETVDATPKPQTEHLIGSNAETVQRSQIVTLLRQLVEKKKRYPKVSRRSGQEGKTELLFKVSATGVVLSGKVSKSCEFSPLNNASEDVVSKIVGTSLGVKGKEMTVVVPLVYSLRD